MNEIGANYSLIMLIRKSCNMIVQVPCPALIANYRDYLDCKLLLLLSSSISRLLFLSRTFLSGMITYLLILAIAG